MISKVLHVLEGGLLVIRQNTRLLLVVVLVFVFPLLFVWVTQSFFETAYDNINTIEKQKVGLIYDSLSVALQPEYFSDSHINNLINEYVLGNQEVVKINVLHKDEDVYTVLYADDPSLVGTIITATSTRERLNFLNQTNDFLKFEAEADLHRLWLVFKQVSVPDDTLYIYGMHDYHQVDSVMSARRQQSYYGLTGIFLFLLTLAYWLNRQVFWQKHHDRLAQQLEERDLFFNMVAHEFRSPLTAIKGYASFLQESKTLNKDELRFASNINHSAERLVVLVSDFLEISRLQAGKMKIEKKDIDLRDVLVQITEDLQVLAKEKGLKLIYEKSKKPVPMNTDPGRMTQVLTNIITNAIKYTESGEVELECTSIPGEVTVRVKDTGMGISAEDQQKLFAPFTRVGGVDGTSIKGTGLGMWITKQLVALLEGTIGVESIKGVGTHIVITFRT